MYNVGVEVMSQPQEPDEAHDSSQLAVIKLNDTFKNVDQFPKIFFKRIPEKTVLPCTALGFSLIGRDLQQTAVTDLINPTSINIKVQYNLGKCLNPFT